MPPERNSVVIPAAIATCGTRISGTAAVCGGELYLVTADPDGDEILVCCKTEDFHYPGEVALAAIMRWIGAGAEGGTLLTEEPLIPFVVNENLKPESIAGGSTMVVRLLPK